MRPDGKKNKQRMKEGYLKEVSSVDRPAQAGALMVIMKRAEVKKRIALTTDLDGHQHVLSTSDSLRGGTSYNDGHSHDWVLGDDGRITIAMANGHTHDVLLVVSKQDDNQLPEPGALADLLIKGLQRAGTNDAADRGTAGVNKMTPEEKAAMDKAAADLVEANKRAQRAETLAQLNDAQRSHLAKLDGAGQERFLALKPEQRQAEVQKIADDNGVIYTSKRNGTTFRKSDDPRMVELAKQLDDEVEARKAAEATAKSSEIRKQAELLKHLPGSVEDTVSLLEAIELLPTEKREPARARLKAQNEQMAKAFERIGTTAAPVVAGSPEAKLNEIAKGLRASNPSLSESQAFLKAAQTSEGQQLYKQMRAQG